MGIKNWYPFYPTDFERDTIMLSFEERAAYRELLDIYWLTEGNILEKFVKNLLNNRGISAHKFKKIWPNISPYFPIVDGKLTNKKMDYLIEDAGKRYEVAVENGKKGGQAKARAVASQVASQTAKQTLEPLPSTSQSNISNNGSAGPDHIISDEPMNSAGKWADYFISNHSYAINEVKTPTVTPMFAEWVKSKVTPIEVEQAMDIAIINRGNKPNSPKYLDPIVSQIRLSTSRQKPLPTNSRDFKNKDWKDNAGFATPEKSA